MILAISKVVSVMTSRSGALKESSGEDVFSYKLELTDGWYAIQATVDDILSTFIKEGLLKIGTKLLVSNAQLQGAEDGIDPLDDNYLPFNQSCGVSLRICANSTRLAKWNAKLGFVKPNCFLAPRGLLLIKKVSDVIPNGGDIPLLRFTVLRRYPLLYLEKCHETSTEGRSKAPILSEAEEEIRRRDFERHVMGAIERLKETIEKDLEKVSL